MYCCEKKEKLGRTYRPGLPPAGQHSVRNCAPTCGVTRISWAAVRVHTQEQYKNHDHSPSCWLHCFSFLVLGSTTTDMPASQGKGGTEADMKLLVPLYIYPLRDGELGEELERGGETEN